MVHRWRCRHCDYTVWSASEEAAVNAVKSHLLEHYRSNVAKQNFQLRWSCPYCNQTGQHDAEEAGLQAFERHLFEHVSPLMEAGVHVADEIGGTGSTLVLAPPGSPGANNARVHFHSVGDVVIFVTTNVEARLRLLQEQFASWPAWTVVITTKDNPLEGLDDIDLSNVPLEVVKLDKGLGLARLGQTISKVVEEQNTPNEKISVEFDILPEIVSTFELQQLFQFLHLLTSRLDRVGALSHYYFDPKSKSKPTMNLLEELFDLTIRTDEATFRTK